MELFGDKKDDAASFGDHDTSGNIFAEKEFFDRNDIWRSGFKDFMKRLIKLEETIWKLAVFGGSDNAEVEGFCICSGGGFNEAKATTTNTWVNSEDFHAIIITYRLEDL